MASEGSDLPDSVGRENNGACEGTATLKGACAGSFLPWRLISPPGRMAGEAQSKAKRSDKKARIGSFGAQRHRVCACGSARQSSKHQPGAKSAVIPGLRAERPTAFWSGGQNSRSNYRQVTWRTRNDAELLFISACAMARPRLCVGGPRRQFTPRQPKRIGACQTIFDLS